MRHGEAAVIPDPAHDASELRWPELRGKKVNLVPVRTLTPEGIERKRAEIRKLYKVEGPLAFLHVRLLDNRSEFFGPIRVRVSRQGDDYVLAVSDAVAIANTIAYLSELLDPISIFIGLSRQDPMSQALRYLLWGEGETGLMLYTILVRYWEETPEEDVRPLIILMSD